jgi:hypothetical protein
MSVGKFTIIAFGILLIAGLAILGCQGDQGPQGPVGLTGPQGDSGGNRTVIPPSDRSFGIMVANATDSDLKGAQLVPINFDSVTVSGSGVAALQLATPPILDGVDDGTAEWGTAPAAAVALSVIQGADNGIAQANVRAGYDAQYFYMLVSWTETEAGDFVPAADRTKDEWTYSSSTETWAQAGGEDRLYVVWDLNGVSSWSTEGLGAVFSDGSFATPSSGQAADLWVFESTETGFVPYLADMVVRSEAEGGAMLDFGRGFVTENVSGSLPKYMRSNSAISGSAYPLWDFEIASFDDSLEWVDGAVIPGYVYFTPSLSAADVEAAMTFSNGTWTVELRRLRDTGNADDVKF